MKHSSNSISPLLGIISLPLLILITLFQVRYDRLAPPFTTAVPVAQRLFFPSKVLPYLDFGFTNILTDFYWISAVQDLIAWNGTDPFYLNYFRNISTLDPKFEYPYLFSILAVPQIEKTTKDIKVLNDVAVIAQKGIDAIPTSWQIPFYLSTQYYIFTKAYEPAEKYLAIAASREGAPDGVHLVYSSFVGKNIIRTKNLINNPNATSATTQDFIKVIYNNTDNETIKKLASKGIQSEIVNSMLEKGIIAYKEKFKHYPKTVQEMIDVHFISLPEAFLDYFTITINPKNGSFKVIEKEEE